MFKHSRPMHVLSPGSWVSVHPDRATGSAPGSQGARRFSGAWCGFTLIELLVVISIIGVLIALTMPSLSAAREAAASTLCATRERQVAVAINTYKTDNSQWYPVNTTFDTGSSGDYGATRHRKYAYKKGTASGQIVFVQQVRPYLQIQEPGEKGYDSRKLHPGRNILACPASDYRPGMTTAEGQKYAVINDGTQVSNYVISAYFGWGDPFLWDPNYTSTSSAANMKWVPKRGEPVAPSRLVLGGEALGASTYFGYLMPNYLSNYYAYFHPNGTANVMLADGHVINVEGHVGKWDPTIYEFYGLIR
jgi:prepilin-type N-terminal cleavage/methylation domain-containing protein/prepilin-type processing-associated H-X9-DG protein